MKPLLSKLTPILLFVVVAGLSACAKKTDGSAPQAVDVGVVTVQAQRQTVITELPGRASAYLSAEIRPQIGGIIQQRLFTEGMNVKKGQSLYQIDPSTYQAAYDSAKASLMQYEATMNAALLKAQRYAELNKIDAVSKQSNDDAQSALKQSQAAVDVARAALQTARINLKFTNVVSPITGRIETSTVTPGALVVAAQTTALTTVQQIDPIYVDITQSSTDLLRLRKELAGGRIKKAGENEASVQILLEDGTTYAHAGKLKFSGMNVNTGTGMITLRIVVPNPDGMLLPGAYVHVLLAEGVDNNALLVPQKAVSRDATGTATALVLNGDGKVEQRKLKIDRAVGNRWWVSAGLQAGDRVIVDGLQKIRVGDSPNAIDMTESQNGVSAQKAENAQGAPASSADVKNVNNSAER